MTSIENYKIIPGFPGYSACLITARIRNDRTGHILAQQLRKSSTRWYWLVQLGGKSRRVHRLVCAAAIGRELLAGEVCRHRDGNCHNNRADNLVPGSPTQNHADRILHDSNGRVLRNQHVREIRALYGRVPAVVLAGQYGVSVGHVYAVATRRVWRGLP